MLRVDVLRPKMGRGCQHFKGHLLLGHPFQQRFNECCSLCFVNKFQAPSQFGYGEIFGLQLKATWIEMSSEEVQLFCIIWERCPQGWPVSKKDGKPPLYTVTAEAPKEWEDSRRLEVRT
ncbi:unnamed protein product [Durusdinium trenchii]|uniref:Uncharacterized protein n=1 Tax=Durusdinium trenchii TaxID=1381693 RepID=A0ABP0RNK0_9DINO